MTKLALHSKIVKLFCLIVQFSKFVIVCFENGGPKWTRTTDLTLIRRAL